MTKKDMDEAIFVLQEVLQKANYVDGGGSYAFIKENLDATYTQYFINLGIVSRPYTVLAND